MPCGWSPRAPAPNPWTTTAANTGPGDGSDAWRPQPFFLMLDDGGFLELGGCGRLVLETADV